MKNIVVPINNDKIGAEMVIPLALAKPNAEKPSKRCCAVLAQEPYMRTFVEKQSVELLQDMRDRQAEGVDVLFFFKESREIVLNSKNEWACRYLLYPVFVFQDLTEATRFKLRWS